MQKPKKWYEIYDHGTKKGDEEAAVFKCLARHPKYHWRSVAAIVDETKLSEERINEIIDKFANKIKPPLIYPHPTNEDHWGYWERDKVKELLDKDDRNISQKDMDNRVDKHLKNKSADITQVP